MKKLFLLILPLFLLAFVNVCVNKKTVYPGEEIIFTIEATGNNIKFPNIKDINHFPVQGTAITQNITILNGNMQKSVSKSYIFFPTKNVTIPEFNVIVDSKTYKTKPIKITVTKPKESKNSDFKIKLSVNKTNAFIGEPIIFKIKFFQKEGTTPQSIEIQKPNFNDFLTKQISKKEYNKKRLKEKIKEAKEQIEQYKVECKSLKDGVEFVKVVLVYKAWELVYCEEVKK